jgi:hypothetical protein
MQLSSKACFFSVGTSLNTCTYVWTNVCMDVFRVTNIPAIFKHDLSKVETVLYRRLLSDELFINF